ncbi:SEF1 [[Candida] subhashii]|uniref:SEF1 n=1 Tax=[Candida] subhashii TaxID=561895 RepID=A0A8J5ULF8_9ASCO|nr:SEF1 [[Candida] subhashii]KAG7662806.1 SEF1 [[Candida] subhashii]
MKYSAEKTKVKSILPKPSPISSSSSPPPPLIPPKPTKRRATDSSIDVKSRKKSNSSTPNSRNQSPAIAIPTLINNQSTAPPILKSESESSGMMDISMGNTTPTKTSSSSSKSSKQTGHRPVTSCTFCRQHKIRCNASEKYPMPCQRCDKMGLKCEIDPQFRPKKGSQIQSLKSDVDELKAKIEMLTKNESLLTQALNQHNLNFLHHQQQDPTSRTNSIHSYAGSPMTNDGGVSPVNNFYVAPVPSITSINVPTHLAPTENSDNSPSTTMNTPMDHQQKLPEIEYKPISEFILGDVTLPLSKANELHDKFMRKYLPLLPIIVSRSATELYHKSQLLFWAVILTASLGEPEPTLYMSLASLIKQLAIETCWIRTPRSTHVIQALIILSIWPLPNVKVLDDCSYRFVGLAKNLSLQLGLHRGGEFIQEFSRNQVSLGPDAERWRTRSWLAVFFCEQFWSSLLGLPPSINSTDYLLENARVDKSLPKDFRCLISLSIFQCKLVNVMGISVTRPDGLLEPSNRAGSLSLLDRELERLRFKLQFAEGSAIEVYYLYIKLMICCFAFLPGTPIEDQVKYVSSAYLAATRIITIVSQLVSNDFALIELPIYVRQAMTYSVFLLFKLHLSRYLIDKYVDSARQSIVTVHRLLRNTLSSWKDLENDISRTAKVLENLNIVLYTYPDIFLNDTENDDASIITRMRSHLTASLFYDLVWCVHEARRRTLLDKNNPSKSKPEPTERKLLPLPFYNQITKDDFKTITKTSPNGTTITTLVPTDQAMNQARSTAAELNKPLEINGIPLTMLEATGSMRDAAFVQPEFAEHSPAPQQLPQQHPQQQHPLPAMQPQQQQQQLPLPSQQHHQVPMNQAMTPRMNQGYLPTIDEFQQPMFMSPGTQQQQQQQAQAHDPFGGAATPANGAGGFVSQIDTFFQQQSHGWMNNDNYQDEDFLGWFDVNMLPEQ